MGPDPSIDAEIDHRHCPECLRSAINSKRKMVAAIPVFDWIASIVLSRETSVGWLADTIARISGYKITKVEDLLPLLRKK